ncbi:MAG: phosphohydrolase [Candidatus Omnitrophota bacterium]|nr:MAG: phosphohydrolase [Candidatus Omnitrophota bacterium]
MQKVISEIIANNNIREKQILSQYACQSIAGLRFSVDQEKLSRQGNIRQVFFQDTDRIIHSSAYSRYIDKTQVFSLFKNDHITHRVLHVQFVSKIARVIGRSLKLNEDLIEAISLGHDLGHAPFGHDGEGILNEICKKEKIGYFCHNAQSVKVLQEIEKQGNGLNLSLQVLDGILAHNGEIVGQEYMHCKHKNWDKFHQEYESCFKIKDYSLKIVPMTLEACVVRIADVLAYLGRDIEDAIVVKLLNREQIPESVVKVIGNTNDKIINTLVMDLIVNSYARGYLMFSKEKFTALKELMRFNYKYIYDNPRIKTEQLKISGMFTQLFDCFLEDLKNENKNSAIYKYFLKKPHKDYSRKNPPQRIVVDFLSGMTDSFFLNMYKKHFLPESYGYAIS